MREDPVWMPAATAARIHYRIAGMEDVQIRRDLPYKTVSSETWLFDYYTPLEPLANPPPIAILIHGGPIPANLLTGPTRWGNFESLGRLIAASGLGAVMFNHRFFAPQAVVDAVEDLRDLIATLSTYAGELRLDPSRLCLWAFSGGGVLLTPFLRDTPEAIRCMVAYYAVMDARLDGNASRIPPLLIARAGLDAVPLNAALDDFVQQALRRNVSIDVLNHPRGQHVFDCRDDNERTRDILRRTVEFIRNNLTSTT
jgi:poly(3-hydroxybutyrate) depolymerase